MLKCLQMGASNTYKFTFGGIVLAALAYAAVRYLHGHTIAVLDPKGPIALQERNLIVVATLIMLIVVIPVFVLTFWFAWKYRATNTAARYAPDWDHNRTLESIWWLIPTAIILVLAVITWKSSHTLDPYRPIASTNPPMTIQVVALDWKWLFIYPQQHIATVNFVQFPVNTPVNFQITADAPMNSFWIPQLGGQIYAMPGMNTQLNLLASSQGNFHGSSANISGVGFAGMTFVAKASSESDFNQWASQVQQSHQALTMNQYNGLAKPSQNNPATYYTSPQSGLFNSIMVKYLAPLSQSTPAGMNMAGMAGMEMQ